MSRMVEAPSRNSAPRDGAVDTLVLHHTAQPLDVSLELLRFGAVSAHYVVDVDGTVYRLVDESRIAWHAGLSWWRDRRGLNATSIGVEIVNLDGNVHDYPDVQRAAAIALCRGIVARHAIAPRDVVGHSDIAPKRKDDPGTLFFWRELAAAGVGLWPTAALATAGDGDHGSLDALLRRIGYAPPHRYGRRDGRFVLVPDGPVDDGVTGIVEVTRDDIVASFQRRFQPRRLGAGADAETTGLARALLALAGG